MTMRRRLFTARNGWWLRGCEHVGSCPDLHGRPSIEAYGGGTIRIGHHFSASSIPVPLHLVAGPGARLLIGDDVRIGHGGGIAAYGHVEIRHGTQIGPFVIVMDTNFHGGSGDQSVQHECRNVVIGRGCRIGSRVTITRGVSIGDGAEILAGSVVSSDVPAGVCAGGARARILGRAGDPQTRWHSPTAMVPLTLMDALGLGAPPEFRTELAGIPGWNALGMRRLAKDIAVQFGVSIEASGLALLRSVSDIVATVEEATRRRVLSDG
jgi:acetyltransferase-like isoleucine patch superfamily enzyme